MGNQRFSFLKELALAVAPAIVGGMVDAAREYAYSIREEKREAQEHEREKKRQ